jgi:hypothetical protein
VRPLLNSAFSRFLALASLCLLSACSSAPNKPQPSPLPNVSGSWNVKKSWTNQIGEVSTPLMAAVHGQQVAVASTAGQLALIDAVSGRDVWRLNLGAPIQAGVGGDGQRFAVVTRNNELVTVESGRVIWRQTLPALSNSSGHSSARVTRWCCVKPVCSCLWAISCWSVGAGVWCL